MTRKPQRHFIWVGLVLASLLCSLSLPSHAANTALDFAVAGQQQYHNQQFSEAALSWQQAADAYRRIGDEESAQKSLINQSQALQDLGFYPQACRTLLDAFQAETLACDSGTVRSLVSGLSNPEPSITVSQSVGLRSLGDVLRRLGLLEESKQALDLSVAIAQGSSEASATWLSLGNTERNLGKTQRNRWDYEAITDRINRQSSEAAIESDRPALEAYQKAAMTGELSLSQVQAQLNQLSLWLDLRDWWNDQTQKRMDSWQRLGQTRSLQRAETFSTQLQAAMLEQTTPVLQQLNTELTQFPASRATVFAQLNFATSLMRLDASGLNDREPIANGLTQNSQIETLLQTALQQARQLNDSRAEAYALGYLGQFYGEQGQLTQATQFTKQALAQQTINREARYLWQAQLGHLLVEQGDRSGALVAYLDAYDSLQSLRSDLNTSNQDVQFDFQQEVKPVYLALADLLLQPGPDLLDSLPVNLVQSGSFTASPPNRLELARQVIESLQLAELDNFFQDPCSEVPEIPVQIDDLDPEAAVIYPMVFRDRLDLILSVPDRPLRHISVPVSQLEVEQTLDQLYDLLNNESIDTSAINIFRTVPISAEEVDQNLQQLLPIFSKIYDWLVQPIESQLEQEQIKTLVFVLNDRLQRIPMAALYDGQKYLIEKYGVALAPSLQLINPTRLNQKRPSILAAGVSQQTQVRGATFPALANVPEELKRIQRVFPKSKQLLNADFTKQSLQRNLTKNYSIVHLATHGLFSSNPENNFIVTGDAQSLGIDDLSTLLKGQGSNALQLLVLSACETATGDEQAVLGLAGMAVRSGASSTLATLWPVSDASTTTFMTEFYQALSPADRQKAAAMKTAQQSLLETLKRQPPLTELSGLPPHPYYWAPYVLVGNWL